MTVVIELIDFSCVLEKQTILHKISLQVYRGEYLSIIGPNGAGKTTLLKCLMRILPGTGTFLLEGKSISEYRQKEVARILSYVPQNGSRYLPFTVEEFVTMGRYPHLNPFTSIGNKDRADVQRALSMTTTTHLAARYMDTLSGGEVQSVLIASALAQGAKVLLLDEATTFLDPKHESDILNLIDDLHRRYQMTVVSVTHNINHAVLHSDRVIILKNGSLEFTGIASDVMDNHILEKIYGKRFSFVQHPQTGEMLIVPDSKNRNLFLPGTEAEMVST